MKGRGRGLKAITLFILLMTCGSFVYAQEHEVKVIREPRYNCEEKEFVELKQVAVLRERADDKVFLFKPWSLVVDSRGNVYVYDMAQMGIVKYDRDLRPVKLIGRPGQGPGDFSDPMVRMNIRDDVIYTGDRRNKRITLFNPDGKVLSSISPDIPQFGYITPEVDGSGNFYMPSFTNIIDVFDSKGQLFNQLLNQKEFSVSLFNLPVSNFYYQRPLTMNISIACTKNDLILVLLNMNGKLFVLNQKHEIVTERFLWPRRALEFLRADLESLREKEMIKVLFLGLVLDRDKEDSFYVNVTSLKDDGQKKYLYEFDFQGNLKRTFFFPGDPPGISTEIKFKRHGLFYGISYNDDEALIKIFKE